MEPPQEEDGVQKESGLPLAPICDEIRQKEGREHELVSLLLVPTCDGTFSGGGLGSGGNCLDLFWRQDHYETPKRREGRGAGVCFTIFLVLTCDGTFPLLGRG
jgi:hypothetical protein